ncbi:hypothetical protein F4777DRAFT_579938 [Nemania sp. FL0916]|nr:hypothetical protein F4777DRAFT_579938 [Nemania sp. FL0916]
MSSDTQWQQTSRLFSLPHEVRDRIYSFYLCPGHDDFEDALRPHQKFLENEAYSRPLPALMRTCKRVYQDMAPHVHDQATMRVEMHGPLERRIGFAVHGTLRFERLRKLCLLVPLEHPNWNRWLYFFSEVLSRCPNLGTLVIDWSPRPVTSLDWAGRVNQKKEDEFLRTILGLEKLHTDVVPFYKNVEVPTVTVPWPAMKPDQLVRRASVNRSQSQV